MNINSFVIFKTPIWVKNDQILTLIMSQKLNISLPLLTMEDMKILSKRFLTLADVEKLNTETSDNLGIIEYEENEELRDSDYIIATVKFKGKKYTFIHGFPGDNPIGGFLDQNWNVVITVGEGGPYDESSLSKWYYKLTADGRHYDNDIFSG